MTAQGVVHGTLAFGALAAGVAFLVLLAMFGVGVDSNQSDAQPHVTAGLGRRKAKPMLLQPVPRVQTTHPSVQRSQAG